MRIQHGETGLTIRGPNSTDTDFTLSAEEIITIVDEGSTSESTVQDIVTVMHTDASYLREYQLAVSEPNPAFLNTTYECHDPTIATVDEYGRVTRVADGTARLSAKSDHYPYIRKGVNCPVALLVGQVLDSYSSYAAGTLGKNIVDLVDGLIADVTEENASAKKLVYSLQNHTDIIYTRSTSCWAKDLDLTPISPWNSRGVNTRAGTLISPRHIVLANHYKLLAGDTIRFVKSDNTVITKTIIDGSQIGSTDIYVCVLDSDIEGVSFAKVLPDGWEDYIPGLTKIAIPCLCLDQEEKAQVHDLKAFPTSLVSFSVPQDEKRLLLYEPLVSGDSGNPAFVIINDELVILCTWYYGGAGSGPNIADYKTEINTAMTTLGGGYQLTEVDLSGFTEF